MVKFIGSSRHSWVHRLSFPAPWWRQRIFLFDNSIRCKSL